VNIAVAMRDQGRCRHCGSNANLHYDHILPYSRGGRSDSASNVQLLCGRCNTSKGARYVG
jgi:5-methylcytosine-specific restriction endonuclease McrA